MPDFYKDFAEELIRTKSPCTAKKYAYYLRRWKKKYPNQPFERTFTKQNLVEFLKPKGNDNQPCRSALKMAKEYIIEHDFEYPTDAPRIVLIGIPKSKRVIKHRQKNTVTQEEFQII